MQHQEKKSGITDVNKETLMRNIHKILLSIVALMGIAIATSTVSFVVNRSPSITDHKYYVIISCRANKDYLDEETKARCTRIEHKFRKSKLRWIKKHLDKSGF